MTSDGRKGLCNDVLVERIPCGVHVGGRGGLAQECTTCTGKQTIHSCAHSFTSFFATFILYIC